MTHKLRAFVFAVFFVALAAGFGLTGSASTAPVTPGPQAEPAPGPGAAETEAIPDRYIVVFESSVASPSRETRALERAEDFDSELVYRRALKGFAAELSPAQVEDVRADPEVALVSPDRPVRALAVLAAGEPTPPFGIRRIEAATTESTRGASRAKVAVIDTGVDLSHPDLRAASAKNCVTPGSPAQDDHGHGTHVAGTVAAKNNGRGVVGVAPGTSIFAVKVLDRRATGTTSGVICGIDWVTSTRTDGDPTNDIAVANMSLGGLGPPVGACASTLDPKHRAICNSVAAGVTYVVSAGNDGKGFDFPSTPHLPAAYPEVLTVTAMTDRDGQPGGLRRGSACRPGEADDRFANASNFAVTGLGPVHTVAAPGVCVRSTAPGGGYQTMSGTSMAAPHVAGLAALCLDERGVRGPCAGISPAQIAAKIRSAAQRRGIVHRWYSHAGSPTRPVAGRYFGPLAWAGPTIAPRPPRIVSHSHARGGRVTATRRALKVRFDKRMNRKRTQRAFSLTRRGRRGTVRGRFSWKGSRLAFRPRAALAPGAGYTAHFGAGAADSAGRALEGRRGWSFRTLAQRR